MSMQEAFRRAAEENPTSEGAHQVFSSVRAQRTSKPGADLVHLAAFFINIGERWTNTRIIHPASQSLGEIRTQWDVALDRRKRVVQNDLEGKLLLEAMVEKGIDPEHLDRTGHLELFDFQLQWPPKSMGLSLGSRLFVYAISDLSRYTRQQNEAIAHFIQEERGKVVSTFDLPIVIPLVNTWLNDHS